MDASHAHASLMKTTISCLVSWALHDKLTYELVHLILGLCKGHTFPDWANWTVPKAGNLYFRLWIHFLEWDSSQPDQLVSVEVRPLVTRAQMLKPVQVETAWIAKSAKTLCEKGLVEVCSFPVLIRASKVLEVKYGYEQSLHSDHILCAPVVDLWFKVASRLISV